MKVESMTADELLDIMQRIVGIASSINNPLDFGNKVAKLLRDEGIIDPLIYAIVVGDL
ncbi:hypothetical protein N752_29515 [Desulforamulus aquiferis]|nr:hypothetical protein [Desulforamulus aquiferis]RYD01717.1 hypothetical protein N752_29515 [Desulforamulus aquiferis]